ncbi:MAG: NAD(P)-dependent oxidoreductase [Candidatus Omnitrophica bacterium]|nr:NAD(P)-dependent oxidoreductase [Candidatus Omnitrophota bacterium]
MKIAVLGSAGLIGKALCKKLKELKIVEKIDGYDILNGDHQDLRRKEVFDEPYDYCFFLACDVGGIKYLENKGNQANIIKNNIRISDNVFRKLEKHNTPFLFASSQLEQQRSAYGAIKRLGEEYTRLLGGQVARFWNVYGYEAIGKKSHVIPDFIHQALTNKRIQCMSDGSEKRQFIYAADCAEGLIATMQNPALKLVDLTSREWISIKEITLLIEKLTGAKATFTGKNYPSYKYIEPTHNEIHKLWKMQCTMEGGIKEIIELYKKDI